MASHPQDAALKSLHQKLRTSTALLYATISQGLRITIGTPEENARTLIEIQAALANLKLS